MPKNVLVVDDDQSTCSLIQLGLEPAGYAVATATSGEAALSLLDAEPADVILTDLNMDGMSGIDLCHQIIEQHADLPVIVITAFGSMETAIEAIRVCAEASK